MLYCLGNRLQGPRLALQISAKNVAGAVARNKIRRMIGEVFREIFPTLEPLDIVVRVLSDISDIKIEQLKKDLTGKLGPRGIK